jgi:YD repeat-containing protein
MAMSLRIAGINFDRHDYDDRGDVLYLDVAGYDGPPARAYSTPEGHNVEYDEDGRVVAMTLVNIRWRLERDGELTITPAAHVDAHELAEVLRPAR